MMPQLSAEETLDQATAVALGSGTLKKADARRVHAALEKQASGRRAVVRRPGPAELAAMGIKVEEVK